MLFTNGVFFVFYLVAFGAYWALRRNTDRKRVLLVGSYVFYGAWDVCFLLLIFGSTLLDYYCGRRIAQEEDPHRRKWLALSLTGNLGVLVIFKYLDFFIESATQLLAVVLPGVESSGLGFVLPVGISLLVFFLCGLWHGANWTFVVFGLYHGLFLILERIVGAERIERSFGPVRHMYVLLVIFTSWIIFRSPTLSHALSFIAGFWSGGDPLRGMEQLGWIWWAVLALLTVALLVAASPWLRIPHERAPDWVFALGFGSAVALVMPWVATGYNPFIYFQF